MEINHLYFSDGVSLFGGYSASQLMDLLFENKLNLIDKIFDAKRKQWVSIMSHPEIQNLVAEKNKEQKVDSLQQFIQTPPPPSLSFQNLLKDPIQKNKHRVTEAEDTRKFYLKTGQNVTGPHTFINLVLRIYDKEIRQGSNIMSEGRWLSVDEFLLNNRVKYPQYTQHIQMTNIVPEQKTWKRNFPRAKFIKPIFVESAANKSLAQACDISTNGLAFYSVFPDFKKNEKVLCTLPTAEFGTVNVSGLILRTTVTSAKAPGAPIFKCAVRTENELTLSTFL